LTATYARTVGIAVDHRRSNRSEESLAKNVARLKEYKAKLIVFPKRSGAIKVGDSSKADTAAATQLGGKVLLPLVSTVGSIEMAVVTPEMKAHCAYTQMRVAAKETKVLGFRASVANRKEKK